MGVLRLNDQQLLLLEKILEKLDHMSEILNGMQQNFDGMQQNFEKIQESLTQWDNQEDEDEEAVEMEDSAEVTANEETNTIEVEEIIVVPREIVLRTLCVSYLSSINTPLYMDVTKIELLITRMHFINNVGEPSRLVDHKCKVVSVRLVWHPPWPDSSESITHTLCVEVPMDDIRVGDSLLVLSGETIPIDGRVLSGRSVVDESWLVGESFPVYKEKGLTVSIGTINWDGPLKIETSSTGTNSSISKIFRMVEDAQCCEAPIQRPRSPAHVKGTHSQEPSYKKGPVQYPHSMVTPRYVYFVKVAESLKLCNSKEEAVVEIFGRLGDTHHIAEKCKGKKVFAHYLFDILPLKVVFETFDTGWEGNLVGIDCDGLDVMKYEIPNPYIDIKHVGEENNEQCSYKRSLDFRPHSVSILGLWAVFECYGIKLLKLGEYHLLKEQIWWHFDSGRLELNNSFERKSSEGHATAPSVKKLVAVREDLLGGCLSSLLRSRGSKQFYSEDVNLLEFDRGGGFPLAIESSTGKVLSYALRSSYPTRVKHHRYGGPILDIKWHSTLNSEQPKLITIDNSVVRIWDTSDGQDGYSFEELFPMSIIGVMRSLLGALFDQLTLYISYWHINHFHKRGNRVKVIEACLVSLIISFGLSLLRKCSPCPGMDSKFCLECPGLLQCMGVIQIFTAVRRKDNVTSLLFSVILRMMPLEICFV